MRSLHVTTLAFSLGLVLVVASFLGAGHVLGNAQHGTPAPGSGITTEVLGRMEVGQAPGQALHLLRVTFAPGATAAAHTHPGATIYHLAAGTLGFTLLDGQAQLVPATGNAPAGTPPAAEAVAIGTEIILNAGDTVTYDGSAVQIERNAGGEPAIVLISNLRGVDDPARVPAPATPTAWRP